jgi:hypothetical protein
MNQTKDQIPFRSFNTLGQSFPNTTWPSLNHIVEFSKSISIVSYLNISATISPSDNDKEDKDSSVDDFSSSVNGVFSSAST